MERKGRNNSNNAGMVKRQRQVDLVTGGTSGIGILLIKRLLERGDEVRVLIRHPSSTDTWKKLPAGVIPYSADITFKHSEDKKVIEDACRGVNNVFHLAAMVDERGTFEDFINVNVVGTENLLKACVDMNPEERRIRFIYMSSTRVYGTRRLGEVLTEESEPKPASPYGETKLMAEQVVKSFAEAHSCIAYTIFRTCTMYGPHYETSGNRFLAAIVQQKMRYVGTGENHLIFIHVEDVVKAYLMAIDNPVAVNKTYNLTDGKTHTLKEIVDRAAALLGVPKPTKSVNPAIARIGARLHNMSAMEMEFLTSDRIVSTDKIKKELNFTPSHDMEKEAPVQAGEFLKHYKK